MKISHFADIHISDSRIQEFEEVLDQLGESIKEQNPDLVVFSGDMFIHRDKLSPKQVQLTRKFFKETLKDYQIIIISGNHDISMSEEKVDSLSAIFVYDSNIKIYTEIGEYLDVDGYRFHMFSYPSRIELVRLGITDVTQVYKNKEIAKLFQLDSSKKNVLLYHGVLEEFAISDTYAASEEAINIGKDLTIEKAFWSRFDAVLAGHLHKYQAIDKAVYPGCTIPLTFADSDSTGWVLWDDLEPTFIAVPQLYPYQTIDVGDISLYKTELTDEAVRRIKNDFDYTNTRIRIKYTISQSQSGEINHALLSAQFRNAKDIKIVPCLVGAKNTGKVSFDDFQNHTIKEIIFSFIDEKKYNPDLKKIAQLVENRIQQKHSVEEERGINFKPSKLRINNFKCFGTEVPELDFSKLNKVVGILGPNKTGKSSLVEAIVWSLFGTTLRNKDIKSVIRNNEKQCKVELEFYSHGVEYKIDRVRHLTSGAGLIFSKKVENKWIDISGAEMKATQKMIEELVGTFDIFIATVYSPQNKIDLLVEKKPTERKKIILDCLGIDVLSRRLFYITDIKKEVKIKLENTKGKLTVYSDQLQRLIGTNPEELLKEFQHLLSNEKIVQSRFLTHIEALSKKVHSYEDLQNEYEEINNKLVGLRKTIEEIRLKILSKRREQDRMESILSDRSIIDRGLQRLKNCKEQLQIQVDEIARNIERKSVINRLKKELETRESGHARTVGIISSSRELISSQIEGKTALDCSQPSCPINAEIQKQKDELRIKLDDINESIENTIRENEIEVNLLKEKIITAEGFLANSFYNGKVHMQAVIAHKEEQEKKWEQMERDAASGITILENIVELAAAYERQVKDLRKQKEDAVTRRSDIASRVATIDRYEKEIEDTRLDLSECNKKIKGHETQIYRCEQNVRDITQFQKDVSSTNKRLGEIEAYAVLCNKYADIVGKTGVIFRIVDRALPIIEKFAQDLLAKTTNGSISIFIDSYKTLSSGGSKDEVSIFIADAKGKRDILEASGSETVLVSLALRAAMANLLSLRMGSSVELFIIDEGMGALDDEGVIVIKSMFRHLGEIFKKVLFITHVAELKDIAQSIVEVSSDSIVSTFKVIEVENE